MYNNEKGRYWIKVNIKTMKKISLIILIFAFLVLGNEALAASADWSNATKGDGLQIYLRRTGWGWRGVETITTSSPQQIVNPLPAAPRTGWGWRRRLDTNLLLINPLPAGARTRWGWRRASTTTNPSFQQPINPSPNGSRTRWGWRGPVADTPLPTPWLPN